jgi:photosystem II stability/assembly factor-like uncharacterized protein
MHRTRAAMLTAAALAVVTGAGAAAAVSRVDRAPAGPAATAHRGPAADPLGAEDWLLRQRVNPDGTIPDAAVAAAIAQSSALGAAGASLPQAGRGWVEVGPSNIGGRVRDIATDPTTRDVAYLATGTGGLWRTADGGGSFATAWDDRLPQSMGAVAVDSHGVVWAGTGEPDNGGGSAYYGNGVYRSTDAGRTWTDMGLADGDTIGKIAIDPRDDDRVFVAVMGALHDTQPSRGLFMTEDGGSTWTRVIAPDSASAGVIDVSIDKADPDIMLATSWDKIRDEKSRIYGKNSFLYRSTDGGRSWANIQRPPLPQSADVPGQQIADTYVGRMGVDFSDTDPARAYLISSAAGGNFNGFFTSTDAGATWTAVGATAGGTLQSNSGGFAWWFGRVDVDPADPLHVFVSGVNLAESHDGGLTWMTSRAPHADQHSVAFDPFTRGKVFLGNDGGVYSSTQNGAALGPWTKTARLPVTQFYELDVSSQDGTRLNAGAQDNGSLKSWAADNTVDGDWFGFVGGDGMMNRIDPTNDRKYYGCSQNGGCRGFVDGVGFTMTIPGARKNWVAPLEFAADPRIMFGGSEFVSRMNTDPGQRVWQQISPDLTEGTEPRAPGFGTITTIGTTPADPNLVYAGTDSGLVWVSRNAMAAPDQVSWQRLTSPVFPGRWVTRITVDPQDPAVAWASFSGWRSGQPYPHVVMTRDGGRTWADIAGKQVPQAPVNDVIRDPANRNTLFIATDVGVFRTTNLGKTWTKLGLDLPLIPVDDIDMPAGSTTLYAATYGRGIWKLSLAGPS